MRNQPALPTHPTKRHPLTGQPLQAIYVRSDGRIFWPMIGAAPEGDEGAAGGAGGSGSGGSGGGGGSAPANATDAQGNDLGYPKDTRVSEMTDGQAAAYWRHYARTHENRFKDLVGDRKPEEVKADLEAYAEAQRAQQTPAEQDLQKRYDQGKADALGEASNKAATAIFRASLDAQGHKPEDINDLVENFNVANFVKDGEVDTVKLGEFVKRFTPADKANERRRDFGGGKREEGQQARGSAGKAEAKRRFGDKTTTS